MRRIRKPGYILLARHRQRVLILSTNLKNLNTALTQSILMTVAD